MMKADRFCKVENMTPEEAIKTINECSWESAAMAMPPYWEVKIIHGKGENPCGELATRSGRQALTPKSRATATLPVFMIWTDTKF